MLVPFFFVATVGIVFSLWRRLHGETEEVVATKTIMMLINNEQHIFPLPPDSKAATYAAIKFCSENGKRLGFTMESFLDCVQPIADKLIDKVNHKMIDQGQESKRTQQLQQQQQQQQRQQQQPPPPPPIHDANPPVRSAADRIKAANIPVTINGVSYMMDFPFDRTTSLDIARTMAFDFCRDKAGSLGFTDEEQTQKEVLIERCTIPILDAVRGISSSSTVPAEQRTVNLGVNGVEYTFDYPIGLEASAAAVEMSRAFCRERVAELGVTEEDARNVTLMEETCIGPLTTAFLDKLQSS